MPTFFRQTIYFLVITFVINAVGWTFNKEAVADVWFNGQHCPTEVDAHSSAKPQDLITGSYQIPCNHWCHTIGHFIGLLSPMEFMTLEFANTYALQLSSTIQFFAPDGRFRPPRILS